MWYFIGGVILGGIITWVITHIYYKRSRRDQNAVSDKLSLELKRLILDDKRKSLTVTDLNELLRDKVIDRTSSETLPYKVCPKCGSENISRSTDFIVDEEAGDDGGTFQTAAPFGIIQCLECGWRDDEIERDYERIKE